MRLIYCPVSTGNINLINNYHPHCLFNPVRQRPVVQPVLAKTEYFADSGGYQLYRYSNHEYKRCIVVPAVGIRNSSQLLVIDPRDLCKRFGQLGIKYGFTLDRPLSDESSEIEFTNNLEESYKWACLMFQQRPKLCPNTELFIPLQYSTKDQLQHAFKKMDSLNPDGYAFPVRGSFDLDWIVWIAYTLSFLYSTKVRKVHMFGSSRREIIFIGAAAIGLQMFEQVSFDSTSWNSLLFDKRPKYLNPDTLKAKYIREESTADIILPRHIYQMGQLSPDNFDKTLRLQLLMLHNALAITRYTEDMANRAKDVESFMEDINTQRYFASKTGRVLTAIKILIGAVSKGHDFVEKWLRWLC